MWLVPEITTEQLIYLTGLLVGAGTGLWAFFVKVWFPVKQKEREFEAQEAARQREHERKLAEDEREHKQAIELKERNAQVLQASWNQDKLATLLELDSSFIRDTALVKLDTIYTHTAQAKDYHTEIIQGIKELTAKFDILALEGKRRADLFTVQNGYLADMLVQLRDQQTQIKFIIDILKKQNRIEDSRPEGQLD